jgi:hypothetical protein
MKHDEYTKNVKYDIKKDKDYSKFGFSFLNIVVKLILLEIVSSLLGLISHVSLTPSPLPPLNIIIYDDFQFDDTADVLVTEDYILHQIYETDIQFSDYVSHEFQDIFINVVINENPIQLSDMVSHSFEQNELNISINETSIVIIDNVSHSLDYNEILIQLSDTIYMNDTLSLQLLYIVTSTKYDGYTIPVTIYNFVSTKYDGYSIPITIYNSVSTKYDGYSISSITI